jgi:hypothetical protein
MGPYLFLGPLVSNQDASGGAASPCPRRGLSIHGNTVATIGRLPGLRVESAHLRLNWKLTVHSGSRHLKCPPGQLAPRAAQSIR